MSSSEAKSSSSRSLRKYQEVAADAIYENDELIVSAPMGSGKTAATLRAVSELIEDGYVSRVLVLAPLRVAEHVWPPEAALWAPELRVVAAVGTAAQRRAALRSDADVICLNFENVVWAQREGLLDGFDMLVVDELTKMKATTTARWKALRKVLFQVRIGLTGTLSAQGPLSLFGQVTLIDNGKRWGKSFYKWREKHFELPYAQSWSWVPRGGAEPKLLRDLATLTHVIDKAEYAKELPPIVSTPIMMDLPPEVREQYDELRHSLLLALENGATIFAGSGGVLTTKLRQVVSGIVYTHDGAASLHETKIDMAEEVLEEIGEPTLVIYQYATEYEAVCQRVPGPVLGRGTSRKAATAAIEAWNRGELPVLYGHPDSMGHGLNIQHGGHHLLWLSLPWSWEMYHQTRGRLLRSGQSDTVFEHVLLMRNTIDKQVLASLDENQDFSHRVATALAGESR